MISIHRDRDFLCIVAVLFGLLYIPAFIYGFFWLWVLPFTVLVVLFLRAMIESAIARVARAGDEAKQAKAIIPELIIIIIVMTLLLFLPFASALWFSYAGTIENIHQSEIDQSLWWFVLGILKKQRDFEKVQYAHVQIILSTLFFMIFEIITICYVGRKKLIEILKVLLHKDSYKFLQGIPYAYSLKNLTYIMGLIGPIIFALGSCRYYIQYAPNDLLNITGLCLYMCFLIPVQILVLVSVYVVDKIQGENL